MKLASVCSRTRILLFLALASLAACRAESTAPALALSIRNDTGDTLVYRVTERETARREIFLGFVDTIGGIRRYSRAPGTVWSTSTDNIWGYVAGAAIHFDLYRVSGTRLAFAGMFDVTDAELTRSRYVVVIPASVVSQ